jgi:hypothetical protein
MQTCPWDGYTPSNFDFCEANVCGWVVEPANTYSCLAYVVVGVGVLVLARGESAWGLAPIGVTAILVGVLSAAYHASRVFETEFLDLFAMYTFSTYALVVTLHRKHGVAPERLRWLYAAVIAVSLVLLILVRPIGVFLFGAQVVAVLVMEASIRREDLALGGPRIDYGPMKRLLAFFVIALAVWIPDQTRLLCAPEDHVLQGHAAWHVLNSACFYFLYRFYRQFDFGGGTVPPIFARRAAATPRP